MARRKVSLLALSCVGAHIRRSCRKMNVPLPYHKGSAGISMQGPVVHTIPPRITHVPPRRRICHGGGGGGGEVLYMVGMNGTCCGWPVGFACSGRRSDHDRPTCTEIRHRESCLKRRGPRHRRWTSERCAVSCRGWSIRVALLGGRGGSRQMVIKLAYCIDSVPKTQDTWWFLILTCFLGPFARHILPDSCSPVVRHISLG